ncbi:hypothetical protein [Bacillus mycoides]|uniref:hypothetical protein n=1 Tax=Bacillus mycoides TaxID=1405 RepID=UPI002112601B|nr:hypothetical protein [Bacillus mycoides]MCQ6531058.1 hypothetical protein [Bacillus mycoides]
MSLKKYVKYTSLGLALSISATTFVPSMSSAQENSNIVSTSDYKAISSNFSNVTYDVTDRLNVHGYKQVGPQQFQLKYANLPFQTNNPQLANEFSRNIEKIRAIQDRANGVQLVKDATDFGLAIARMVNQTNFSLAALSQLIVNYIGGLPNPDTREFLTAIGELHKMWLHEVYKWN